MSKFTVGDKVTSTDYPGKTGTIMAGTLSSGKIRVTWTETEERSWIDSHEPSALRLTPAEPVRVLVWRGDTHEAFYRQPDGRLTVYKDALFDAREYGWVEDPRVTIPQEPPERKIEPGLWMASSPSRSVTIMRRTDDAWEYPDGPGTRADWQPLARLTPEQVAAVEAAQS